MVDHALDPGLPEGGHPDFPYADYAKRIVLSGVRVGAPADVDAAITAALGSDRPFVLEVICDPDVPPIPPHITFEQAAAYVSAILSGDPNLGGIVRRSFSNLFPSLAGKVEE